MVDESSPMGACACCILDKEHSLVTTLSAANNYKFAHLNEAAKVATLEKATVVYSASSFMTVCPAAMEVASKQCNKAGQTYGLKLSAPLLMKVSPFKAVLNRTMPYVDFLVGNETEALTYAKTENWSETDIPSIAKKVAALPKEGDKPRTVRLHMVLTPRLCASNGEITEQPI
jgi:adenosine kinase